MRRQFNALCGSTRTITIPLIDGWTVDLAARTTSMSTLGMPGPLDALPVVW